jgi:membrane-associated phospholipid phosphatase
MILALVFTTTLISFLKEVFKVERPADALVELSDYAFPSGHSGFAFAIATVVIYWTIVSRRKAFHKILYVALSILFVAAVVFQRLYLNVHTWWQVLGGAVVGFVVSLICIKFVNVVSYKK